jgi:hypothetical protein
MDLNLMNGVKKYSKQKQNTNFNLNIFISAAYVVYETPPEAA